MENYLVNRETLGQFVDDLITQKYQNQPPKDVDSLRNKLITSLDDRITNSLFEDLSGPQLEEVNRLLDNERTSPATFLDFFEKAGVNLQQKITAATIDFKNEFIGEGING